MAKKLKDCFPMIRKENEPVSYTHLVGLVLFGLAFFGVLTVRFPSALCGILSFLVLAAFLIFRRQTVAEELKKKFHF